MTYTKNKPPVVLAFLRNDATGAYDYPFTT